MISERADPEVLERRIEPTSLEVNVDAPYEAPEHPELRVDTAGTSVDDAVEQIIELLRARPRLLAKGQL